MIILARSRSLAALICLSIAWGVAGEERATAPATRPVGKVIRVLIYDDAGGGGQGPANVSKCLAASKGKEFSYAIVSAEGIRAGRLKEADVLVQPGGSGSGQAEALKPEGREAIKEFVRGGGGYVGICAGAYLASADYAWSLHILNAKVVDRQHWARGTGEVKVRMTAEGRRLLGVSDEVVSVFYGQGPLLAAAGKEGLPAYEALGTYETEIAEKGAPAGVMKGTTAFAAAEFGKGRVVCLSPHPEKSAGLDGIIRRAVGWASGAGGEGKR
ncbi:MAG: biotin apo-protein ligase-related protein [Phycisphaerales bacterium]|nr:biotin apo-protein ligase-related protein [Phycisphaerales bacterium]